MKAKLPKGTMADSGTSPLARRAGKSWRQTPVRTVHVQEDTEFGLPILLERWSVRRVDKLSTVGDPCSSPLARLAGHAQYRAARAGSLKGGCVGILALATRMKAEHPERPKHRIFEHIPESHSAAEVEVDGTAYEVWRDGGRVFQRDLATGKQRDIGVSTFHRRYLA